MILKFLKKQRFKVKNKNFENVNKKKNLTYFLKRYFL